MTVRFKGITEYRSRYKDRASRSRSDSPHQRMRLAGLRSDQSRITREPQFPSKRKVPFYPPRISRSLQWEGHCQERGRPVTTPAVKKPVFRASSAEGQLTPLAPRDSIPQEGAPAPSQQQAEAQAAQPTRANADGRKQGHAGNGVNHALRKRAGLKSGRQKNGRLNSEYQRQFMWKTPVADSPLLAAQEMFYKDNKIIPPFKSNPVIMESEYRRSFKGSPPPRPPRLRRDVEQCEVPQLLMENITSDKNMRRKKKKERQKLGKKSSPEEEVRHPQQEYQKQEESSPCAPRDPSHKIIRKAKTEYRSNFRSPLQYSYRDGAWVKNKTAQLEECEHWWYNEVQELRERAEAYRKRARGTHFSRQHFNQIMSKNNWMWEPSSGTTSTSSVLSECCSSPIIEALDLASPGPSASVATSRRNSADEMNLSDGPTLPVQRKLAWDEEARPGERNKAEELAEDEEPNVNGNDKRLQVLETDSSSVVEGSEGSVNGGRLPTPKLKTTQNLQRTHHDRTTPSTGGALLVSPPKIKDSSWKAHSPYRHITDGSPQRTHGKAMNGSAPHSSPAAGLTTVDPIPMREDPSSEEEPEVSPNPRQAKPSLRTPERQRPKDIISPPANRIQGTLRNPEFQHNGNLGIFRPEPFAFPESDSGVSDNDDKMSQISSRSAASCSMASEVLSRAQRRKQEFWGKS